jgi:hypothetical protein
MKVELQPYSKLIDFEKENDLNLVITEREIEYVQKYGLDRFCCDFEHAEVQSVPPGFLIGVAGNGNTIESAMVDYMRKISGKVLVVSAYSGSRQEIDVPTW